MGYLSAPEERKKEMGGKRPGDTSLAVVYILTKKRADVVMAVVDNTY
jgi:hypothetical protein